MQASQVKGPEQLTHNNKTTVQQPARSNKLFMTAALKRCTLCSNHSYVSEYHYPSAWLSLSSISFISLATMFLLPLPPLSLPRRLLMQVRLLSSSCTGFLCWLHASVSLTNLSTSSYEDDTALETTALPVFELFSPTTTVITKSCYVTQTRFIDSYVISTK